MCIRDSPATPAGPGPPTHPRQRLQPDRRPLTWGAISIARSAERQVLHPVTLDAALRERGVELSGCSNRASTPPLPKAAPCSACSPCSVSYTHLTLPTIL